MELTRLQHPSLRAWLVPCALAAVLVVLQLLGPDAATTLPYERDAILARGDYARLVTGHFYHYDFAHLGWNLAGLALVAWLFLREYSTGQWLAILAASTAAVDLGFLVLEPQLAWYVGFSGVLHGLMAAGLVAWLLRERDTVTAIVAVAFALKLGWEQVAGPLPFTAHTLAIPVVVAAHTYGAIGGAVAGAWITLRRLDTRRSL
jgi:rhomboid family GlyGly-CTERM serine protease